MADGMLLTLFQIHQEAVDGVTFVPLVDKMVYNPNKGKWLLSKMLLKIFELFFA